MEYSNNERCHPKCSLGSSKQFVHYKKSPQYLATICATIGAFSLGNALGWSSACMPNMTNSTGSHQFLRDFDSKSDIGSWIASIVTLGALGASLTVGIGAQFIGRKLVMIILAPILLIGWIAIVVAPNVKIILLGRFLTGYAGGAFTLLVPVYVKEIAEDSIRGILANFMTIFVVSGIEFIFVMGSFVDWQRATWVCCIFPILLFVSMLFMPETPRFLLTKNKTEKAKQSLRWLRGVKTDDQVNDEIGEIIMNMEKDKTQGSHFKDLISPGVLKPTLICMTMMFLDQFGGVKAVLFYATDIFRDADAGVHENVSAIIIGGVQIISVIVSTLLIERLGRKLLLVTSETGMSLSLIVLGVYFYLKDTNKVDDNLGWLPLVSLIIYIMLYNLAMGPLPWTLLAELMPSHVIDLTSSIATSFCWTLAFVITKSFPNLLETLNGYGCYWLFSAISLAGALFCHFIVPETKSKSAQDMQDFFR